jgi:outer membrane protein
MAQARWSVFDGSRAASEIARAEILSRQAASAVRRLERDVRLAVYSAHNELETARERLLQTEISIDLARTSLTTVEDRYREGMVTLVELLDAQTGLTRALAREVAVRRDLVVAAAGLQLATGAPLGPETTTDLPTKLPESSR